MVHDSLLLSLVSLPHTHDAHVFRSVFYTMARNNVQVVFYFACVVVFGSIRAHMYFISITKSLMTVLS